MNTRPVCHAGHALLAYVASCTMLSFGALLLMLLLLAHAIGLLPEGSAGDGATHQPETALALHRMGG